MSHCINFIMSRLTFVKAEQIYIAFFKVWIASMVPKLIPQPKWFKECPKLKPGGIIYFKKK